MDYTLEDALPTIYIEKNDKRYDLHWDSYENEASKILNENQDYIEGFMEGCYQILSCDNEMPNQSWFYRSGFVPGLSKEVAEKLEVVIKNLLHSFVTTRYNHLKKQESLPEIHKQHMKRLERANKTPEKS